MQLAEAAAPGQNGAANTVQPHGHGLLMSMLADVAARSRRGYLIEIGSTREKLPGQGSTVVLGRLAADLGLPFITVDMDPANTEQARLDLGEVPGARAVTAKGEAFLASFDEPILAAYLDAFDIQHGKHSQYRVDRYLQYLNTEITDDGAAAMHAACARALLKRIVPGGLVVIDDTWQDGDGYVGKGRDAVPLLLAGGFRIVNRTKSAIALEREVRPPSPLRRLTRPVVRPVRRVVKRARKTVRRQRKAAQEWRSETALAVSYRLSPEGRRSRRALRRLHNSARGRCVIIGNGPSLNKMDLSVLKDVPTFGLNRGYLLFGRIGGPTTYLVSVNRHVLVQYTDEMLGSPCPKFFNWRHRRAIPAGRDDVVFVNTSHEPGFSTDLVGKGMWEGATVTFVAMQLAYHMGYREVVLIGVDHAFATPGPAHMLVTSIGGDQNHFDPNYFARGFRWQLPDLEMSERAYAMARAAFEAAGGRVVDATVDGKLTVFPKVDFEELFPGPEAAPGA
jgi:hypothetical protein